jgi:hypothetical protein
MAKRLKRPRDPNQLAMLIVDIATGEWSDDSPRQLDPPATEARRRGGSKGGAARAKTLGAKKRREIARRAAGSRRASEKRLRPS